MLSAAAIGEPVVTRFCGSGEYGSPESSTRLTASFNSPQAVCVDPRHPTKTGFFIADSYSIRYFDQPTETVTLLAGGDLLLGGKVDGSGAAAVFDGITGMVVESDGETLWCADSRGGLRRVKTASGEVTTCYPFAVYALCWNRAPNVGLECSLYCLTIGDGGEIERFDTVANAMRPRIKTGGGVQQIECTSTGHLFVFRSLNVDDLAMFVLDPNRSDDRMKRLPDLYVNSDERFFVCDSSHTLITYLDGQFITYTLPPEYFLLPKCCDRDL